MGYALPVGDVWVSANFHNHCCERQPPSSEPGTDYASAYGTTLVSPADGRIIEVKASNSGATGRYIAIEYNDGQTGRTLHLSEIWVETGWWVTRGQAIGRSGASGYGTDWYYGAHAHQTQWPGGYWCCATVDFEPFVGSNEEDDMTPEQAAQLSRIASDVEWLKKRIGGSVTNNDPPIATAIEHVPSDVWNYKMSGKANETDEDAVPTETGGERLRNIRRSTNYLKGRTERIEATVNIIDANTSPHIPEPPTEDEQ